MRVLFSSTRDHGHVFPMVPLARALRAAGHEVLWACHPEAGTLLEPTGIDTATAGLRGGAFRSLTDDLVRRAGQLPPPERSAFLYPAVFGAGLTPARLADLLPLARAWGPDLLVHEQGELAAPLVGVLLGVRSVTHSFGGAIPPAFLAEAGRRLSGLWAEHGLTVPPYAGCFQAPFLDICPTSVQPVPTDHIALVQQLRPESWVGPEVDLPAGLAGRGPLVYLTLGTVRAYPAAMRAAVDAVSDLAVRVLVTVGPRGDPADLGPRSGNVTVLRYLPQTQVLPLCDLVVSHAGSGTFLGALAHGLPQLCLPQAADQFRNAGAGERAGVSLALHPGAASADAIRAAVVHLLGDGSFGRAARTVATEIARMPSPAAVVSVLAALV